MVGVVGLALATTACNIPWGPYAARVGDSDISQGSLDMAMAALKADPGFTCLEFGSTFRETGAGEHTYDLKSADFVLNQLIEYRIERQLARSLGATPPGSATSLASAQLTSRLESQLSSQTSASCPRSGTDLSKLGAPYRNVAVGLLATEDAIAAHLAGASLNPSSLAAYEAAHRSSTSETCVSVIEVPTKALATSLEHAIKHGASFATEASAHSIDTGNAKQGGALGCASNISSLGSYASAVERLAVHGVTAPLAYNSGSGSAWLLFSVTSRPAEAPDALLEQLLTTERTPFLKAVEHGIAKAHVLLSSQYGTWKNVGEIVPPSTAANRYAPDPSAVVGPSVSTPSTLPGGGATGGG